MIVIRIRARRGRGGVERLRERKRERRFTIPRPNKRRRDGTDAGVGLRKSSSVQEYVCMYVCILTQVSMYHTVPFH